jgi:hypothetical protein
MRSDRIRPKGFYHIVGMPCLVDFTSGNEVEGQDILDTAALCIRKYGNEAALIAWGVADGYALEGDLNSHDAWMQVMDAIEAMNARNSGEGQRSRGPGPGQRL